MEYNKIIITNLPAFYKINLFNEINLKIKLFVVFTGEDLIKRNRDFSNIPMQFDNLDLSGRNKIVKTFIITRLILTTNANEIIVAGWDQIYYWIVALVNKRKKNGVIVESSIFESQQFGIKRLLKKYFLEKFTNIYVSGIAQEKLVESILRNDRIRKSRNLIKTGGVGIFRFSEQPDFHKKEVVSNFLYVGRLSPEKNLEILIEIFNKMPWLNLTIIGEGIHKDYLLKLKNDNINILGYVKNDQLKEIYRNNDVFILPSKIEPWGLVVEEALNNGLPLILSNKVGCYPEYIENKGLIFKHNDIKDLYDKIMQMTDVVRYNEFSLEVSKLNFSELMTSQVLKFC